jgi:hypothetical protein
MRTHSMITLLALTVAGCGNVAQLQPGEVQVALTGAENIVLFNQPTHAEDKPHWGVTGAVVTIEQIDAHVGGKWIAIMTTPEKVDLLQLDKTTLSTLGIATLPTGKVDGLRMKLNQIGDYVILKDGTKKPLLVPDNGYVKIGGKIDLDSCSAGTLIVDFDPHLDIDWLDGRRVYQLTCRASIKTAEIKNVCPGNGGGTPDGGGTGGTGGSGGGGGHMCDMGHGGGPKCTTDSQCGNGMVCSNGSCIPDPCQGVSCGVGEVCSAGACIPDPCNGISCQPGQTCVNGSCQ